MDTNEKVQTKSRLAWIDFAKFIGILFVLMNHIALNIPFIGEFGYVFCVPLFFVLAGYTYHQKEESFLQFLKQKARRLLLPYFTYSFFLFLFFFIKDYILTGKMNTITWNTFFPVLGIFYARNSLYPLSAQTNIPFMTILNSPMWFLPALFVTTVLFEVCMRLFGTSWKKLSLNNIMVFALGIAVLYVAPFRFPWSLDTALLFLVFMSSGYILKPNMKAIAEMESRRNRDNVKFPVHILALIILLMISVGMVFWNGPVNYSMGDFGHTVFTGTMVGIISSYSIMLLCYLLRNHIPTGAALIGRSSLVIMCLHMFVFMFLKTGIQILFPTLLEENSIASVFAKAMCISVTFAVLTIFDLWMQMRKSKTGRKQNG